MAWFKVDDGFSSSPKVLSIRRRDRLAAVGLWTLAGVWSAKHLTDGFIPAYMLEELAAEESQVDSLVASGLWREEGDGYQFHDWHDYQPTRVDVLANRERERQRKEAYRARKAGNTGGSPSGTPPAGDAGQERVSGHPDPTRPDPTRPTKDKHSPRIDDAFERAYVSWPKKVEKKKSRDKFKLLAKKHDPDWLADQVIRFGAAYANTTEVRYVPALVVWLNGERWTDELPTASTDVINAQWDAAMGEHRPDPCVGGHKWAVDGECVRCQTRRDL